MTIRRHDAVEVAVIGAGIHGVSAALHLAGRGVETAIFDRGAPAGGPTGRSSAVCRSYYTNAFLAGLAREGIQLLRDFREFSGGRDAGYHQTGALFLHGAEDVALLRATAAALNAMSTTIRLLDVDTLRAEFGDVDAGGVAIAAWEEHAGHADPVSATTGMFERAVELGLQARLHTAVVRIEAARGGGAVLHLAGGSTVSCERLLIAAGPWTRGLVQQIGVDLPLTVERHIVAVYGWSAAPRLPFVLADVIGGFYSRPEGSELFIAGPLHAEPQVDPDDFRESLDGAEVEPLSDAIVRRVPALAAAEQRGGWASLYDVSPDWQPVIGEIADGIVVDAGTSGHGFKLAPALGRHVAGLVIGDVVDTAIAQFHPRRFESGALLAAGFGDARILG